MKQFLLLLSAALLGSTAAENWAVLVCGSRGYWNYRHHADVCHAYQILTSRGIKQENIITMMYDDVANAPNNPFPGKLFNKPTANGDQGIDVYASCNKDYTGRDVNPDTFKDVMTGEGSGKVLKSTEEDDVFVYFVDHGATGLVAFPNSVLHAKDLRDILDTMHSKKMYKQLVFYLEACESGSMFEDFPSNRNVFVTTAANGMESSWGTYCPPHDYVNGQPVNTCLGDLYSVNWMEDADKGDNSETLQQQYETVKEETAKSHVLEFGSSDMGSDLTSRFLGKFNSNANLRAAGEPSPSANRHDGATANSRDIPLVSKFYTYLRNPGSVNAEELIAEIRHREEVDAMFRKLVTMVVKHENLEKASNAIPPESPQQWGCLKDAIELYKEECAPNGFTDYSIKYSNSLLWMCEDLSRTMDEQSVLDTLRNSFKFTCTPDLAAQE